jgi:MFS family permease
MILAMLRFLPTFYWGMALILIPLLLKRAGAGVGAIALYATVSQICASLGQIAVGRAMDRLPRKRVAVLTYSAFVLSVVGTGLAPDNPWSVMVFGTLGATTAWSLSTIMPTLVALGTEPQERGRVLGWIHLWWNVGMITGSLVGGALYELSAGLPFLLAGGVNVASVLLVLSFFRRMSEGEGQAA